MRRILLSIFILVYAINSNCQDRIITGTVIDKYGESLVRVSVCQGQMNCQFTDYKGTFHLPIDTSLANTIKLSFIGLQPVEIHNIDTITQSIRIRMSEEILNSNHSIDLPPVRGKHFGLVSLLKVDIILSDFSEYKSLLNDYNIKLMNKNYAFSSLEMGGTYNNFYGGISYGVSFGGDWDHDSLDIELNLSQYGLHFGYNLINSRRFLVTPKFEAKWNRYRLINNDSDRKIPIEQYISERDVDIRFNQMTGFAGLNLSYKFDNNFFMHSEYWTIGIYGGYCFKFNDNPWIYTKRNRLISNSEINIKNYNIGMHFSFNIE